MKYRSLSDMDGWFLMVSSRSKCWPSIVSQKTEPKDPSAPDMHADVLADTHADAMGKHKLLS